MKPNEQIYQIAQDKTNCDKDQVLFIDDRDDNVEAADKFGWNAHVAMGGLDICHYLSTYGLIK
jgi:HAD superfamily hydrolase (TIGR01509 family)